MINLFRGEFYKLYKSKAFWICCLVGCFMVVFVYGCLFLADAIQSGELENGSGGIYVSSDSMQEDSVSLLEQVTILDILPQLIFGNFGSIITVIFAAIFVVGEYGSGAIKNVAGKGYARWKIFAAKYISALTAAIFQLVLLTVFSVLSGTLMQYMVDASQKWNAEFFRQLFCYTGVQLFLGAALVGIIVMFSEMCRNLAAGIAIGLGVVSFSGMITDGMDLFIHYVCPQSEIYISDYWIMNVIANCPLREINGKSAVHAIMVAVVWSILAAAAGMAHFKRADIK